MLRVTFTSFFMRVMNTNGHAQLTNSVVTLP
jgi:hypothetical protein